MNEGASKRQLVILSHPNVQTRSMGGVLAKEAEATLLLRTSLQSGLDTATLAGRTTVVLLDCTLIPPSHAFPLLEIHNDPAPKHVYLAFLNAQLDHEERREAVIRGIRAFFGPEDDLSVLIRGIKTLFAGEVWIPRKLLYEVAVDGSRLRTREVNGIELLSPRETEVLSLISDGVSNEVIANRLFISSNTVKTHLYNIYRKLRVPNRMQAAIWAAKHLH